MRKCELIKAVLCPTKGNDLTAANQADLQSEALANLYGACLDKQNCSTV